MDDKNTVGEQAAKSFVTIFCGCCGCCGCCVVVVILMVIIGMI